MPKSLKVKFKSLRNRFLIDDAEYLSMCKKLDGHDLELLDNVEKRIHQKMCSENCGERQCVDAMDRCVWYGYVTEVIAEMKAEIKE